MSHAMVTIPIGIIPLNLVTVRRAMAYLRGLDVMPFNDGMYHATISLEEANRLLNGFSQHDASDAGFEIVNDNPIRFVFGHLRWEIIHGTPAVQIFGPKSDPLETKVFEQEVSDGI